MSESRTGWLVDFATRTLRFGTEDQADMPRVGFVYHIADAIDLLRCLDTEHQFIDGHFEHVGEGRYGFTIPSAATRRPRWFWRWWSGEK
jgi:hypothetical protein